MADDRILEDVIARIENPGPALEGPVAAAMRVAIKGQFETQGARLGTPWAPRSMGDYVDRLFARYDTLVRTGTLERSLTVRGAEHGSAELQDGGKTLAITTDAPGAVEAQEGTRREPARPIVPDELPDDVLEEIADRIGDYILEGLL